MRAAANNRGFTLIELMIVIAILAVLVAIAVPQFQNYSVRAKVSEGINVAAGAKMAVSETFHSKGEVTDQDAAGFVFEPTEHIEDIEIEDDGSGRITVITRNTGAPSGEDPELVFTPVLEDGGIIAWDCDLVSGSVTHVPAECRSSAE